ncbi:hypothetical protein HNP82_000249 [Catenibacillus scindens]|uniref:Uncharacterized protein n=1 Tax=Catenibacillus scindens TaxID=673271 RepID=A0A7W8M3K9_9FIRM|nr:hypothetical protein [Catenibacillus scindens]MBB5263155.1 hypothetical protein [Catenibacillus scindens]
MAKNNTSGCKSCPKRYVSTGAQNGHECHDICTDPICGEPDVLTLLAPVVYDELGINLCRTIDITPPQATGISSVCAQIINISFNSSENASTTVAQINGRPNCYLVTLTNLSVTFQITFYDCAGRSLDTQTLTATYLPSDSSVDGYDALDDDTNPSSVELEIFAPYGVSVNTQSNNTPVIQYVGFSSENNTMHQGLNMIAIPKILNMDLSSDTITIGLTVYVKSIYYSQYLIPHNGRAIVPKASIQPNDDTICMDFVCGDLLDLSIKPLELGPPKCEGYLKNACEETCDCCTCSPVEPSNTVPSTPASTVSLGSDGADSSTDA